MKAITTLAFAIILSLFSLGGRAHGAPITEKEFVKIQADVKAVNDKYEYIVKNFEIQNNTILYVSAVLGSLLALVIFYFGWKAQKVENEYDNIRKDRDRFREQYDKLISEFNCKLDILKSIESDINVIKNDIEQDKDSIKKLIESFVLEYTEDYIVKNMGQIIENKTQNKDDSITGDINQKLEDVSNHLKILDSLQHVSNPQLLYKKIDILFTSKRYNDVIRVIESIIEDDNFNKDYLFKYAYSLNEVGRIDEAFNIYTRYIESKPNDTAAMNNLGLIHKKRNEIDKAINLFEKALENSKKLLYISNLLECYNETKEKLDTYKKYWDDMKNDNDFILKYKNFIEAEFCINEVYDFHKSVYDNTNNSSTYLNLLEASIISRNDNKYDELIKLKDQYNFSAKDNIAFKLLVTINQCLNGDYRMNELNDIEIILDGSSSLDFSWDFNLLERITPRLEEGEVKSKILEIMHKLDDVKSARPA